VIVIVSDVSIFIVADLSRRVRERVPDGRATAVLRDRTFDLIGGRGSALEKSRGKSARIFGRVGHILSWPSGERNRGFRRLDG
jgi:hypothetical protein